MFDASPLSSSVHKLCRRVILALCEEGKSSLESKISSQAGRLKVKMYFALIRVIKTYNMYVQI